MIMSAYAYVCIHMWRPEVKLNYHSQESFLSCLLSRGLLIGSGSWWLSWLRSELQGFLSPLPQHWKGTWGHHALFFIWVLWFRLSLLEGLAAFLDLKGIDKETLRQVWLAPKSSHWGTMWSQHVETSCQEWGGMWTLRSSPGSSLIIETALC